MTDVSHGDLQRDLGRMEGKADAMGARMDRLEKIVSDGFEKLDVRLARIEAAESQRKGALAVLLGLAGAVGAAVWGVVEWVIKGAH